MLREPSKVEHVEKRYDAVLAIIRDRMRVAEVPRSSACIATRCTSGSPATRRGAEPRSSIARGVRLRLWSGCSP